MNPIVVIAIVLLVIAAVAAFLAAWQNTNGQIWLKLLAGFGGALGAVIVLLLVFGLLWGAWSMLTGTVISPQEAQAPVVNVNVPAPIVNITVPAPVVNITVIAPTPLPAQPTVPSGLFGSGSCIINGATYNLMADSSAVWMDSETQKVLASYGGTCNVTTVVEGWYWSVGHGTITHNSARMERGNALDATPGNWTFTYDAPAVGTTNESLGLAFRDNLPKVETSNDAFGTGTCTIKGQNYSVAYDATAVWEDDETLRQLWQYGGSCTVTTVRSGWYWSTTGTITLDGKIMATGQRLVAPTGSWTFVYKGGGDANGFTIRDNVPFGQ